MAWYPATDVEAAVRGLHSLAADGHPPLGAQTWEPDVSSPSRRGTQAAMNKDNNVVTQQLKGDT